MKIQAKTTLLFTVVTATIFLILNITVYFFINSYAHADFIKRLELRARISAKFRFEQGEVSTESFRAIQRQYLEKLPEEEAFIAKANTSNQTMEGALPKDVPERFVAQIISGNGATAFYQSGFRHFAGLLYKDETGDFVVIESATNKYGSQMMRQLRLIKLFTLIGAVVLIYSVGRYFSKKTFQPFRDITARVQQISEGNLHLRLPEREGGDEIAELTGTFNRMLSRLETAFETQHNFISNASHELRTPLTAIVGEADYALSKERTVAEYQQSLQQIMHQAGKLQQLTKGLLALAQTGFDGKKITWEPIRLDELLFSVKEACNALLPENNIRLELGDMPAEEAGITIRGNADLLKVAVSNVVINACKYSNNRPVLLRLQPNGKTATIEVQDKGIGIPQEELKYIYDPFFRASNTGRYDGYGIGMPLTNNIVRLHKGVIHVSSSVNVGTTVQITLPIG